ncbi:MAG: dipeptidase [Myxococcota bacterium]
MTRFLILWLMVGGVGFLAAAKPRLRSMNGRVEIDLPVPTAEARKLHRELRIADLHADSLLWPRDLGVRSTEGQVDIPRLLEGNVSLQVFSVVTKVPKGQNPVRNRGDTDVIPLLAKSSGWPSKTWGSTYERALHQARAFDTLVTRMKGALIPIRTRGDLSRYLSSRSGADRPSVAGLLALEGLHMLGGDLSRLDVLYAAGYRMGGLTHFFDNSVGGSAHGWDKGGMTPFGRKVVARMEALGMVVDLAHASPKVVDDVLEIAKKPVVVSHTGVRGTCDRVRNLSDDQIDRIAKTGGVIGIGYWRGAICTAHPDGVARAVRYVAERVGIEYVGLGSDYDGAVSTAFDASELVVVTDALLRADFNPSQVRAIMGGNVLRVLGSALP